MITFKVGDKVKIKKGTNWGYDLNRYIGQIVTITYCSLDGDKIRFKNDGSYTWRYSEEAFEMYETFNEIYELW